MPNIITPKNNNAHFADIDEVLATPPWRLVKYSNTILLAVLLILFGLSFYLRYNDGIYEPAIIHSRSNTMVKSTNQEATIEKIFVGEGKRVKAGDTLLLLANGAISVSITAPGIR